MLEYDSLVAVNHTHNTPTTPTPKASSRMSYIPLISLFVVRLATALTSVSVAVEWGPIHTCPVTRLSYFSILPFIYLFICIFKSINKQHFTDWTLLSIGYRYHKLLRLIWVVWNWLMHCSKYYDGLVTLLTSFFTLVYKQPILYGLHTNSNGIPLYLVLLRQFWGAWHWLMQCSVLWQTGWHRFSLISPQTANTLRSPH